MITLILTTTILATHPAPVQAARWIPVIPVLPLEVCRQAEHWVPCAPGRRYDPPRRVCDAPEDFPTWSAPQQRAWAQEHGPRCRLVPTRPESAA